MYYYQIESTLLKYLKVAQDWTFVESKITHNIGIWHSKENLRQILDKLWNQNLKAKSTSF